MGRVVLPNKLERARHACTVGIPPFLLYKQSSRVKRLPSTQPLLVPTQSKIANSRVRVDGRQLLCQEAFDMNQRQAGFVGAG